MHSDNYGTITTYKLAAPLFRASWLRGFGASGHLLTA
jgi:hypothetical protein